MVKGIKRLIAIARRNVQDEISSSRIDSLYSRGLSGEGYFGGYRDALDDVILALNGVHPNRNHWWEKRDKK